MIEPFREYREVGVADPLRQGDVLEAADPTKTSWQKYLLVITADCDLSYFKHHGCVTCVPLMPAQDYLMEMQVPRIREKLAVKLVGTLRQCLPADRVMYVSDQRLREWPQEAEPDEIITALGVDGRNVDKVRAALESMRLAGQHAVDLNDAVELLIKAQLAAPNPPKRGNAVDQVVSRLKAAYADPPGGGRARQTHMPSRNLCRRVIGNGHAVID